VEVAFDTSAIVKLILDEAGSAEAETLWESAALRILSALVLPEAAGALSTAARDGRLSGGSQREATGRLRRLWERSTVVQLDYMLAEEGAILSIRRALTGADAVHLATALAARTPELVFATWDRRLAEAARAEGLTVAPAQV